MALIWLDECIEYLPKKVRFGLQFIAGTLSSGIKTSFNAQVALNIYNSLSSKGFHFEPLDIEADLAFNEDWGNCYYSLDHFKSIFASKFNLELHLSGRSQFNQDVLVLSKKPWIKKLLQ